MAGKKERTEKDAVVMNSIRLYLIERLLGE